MTCPAFVDPESAVAGDMLTIVSSLMMGKNWDHGGDACATSPRSSKCDHVR